MSNHKTLYKKFVRILLGTSTFILLSTGIFNFIMDPLWNFSHKHSFNHLQKGFDERQQKTNKVHFQVFNANSLLMGSSRATLLDQNILSSENSTTYNYAISLSMPQEYRAYINFSKEKRGKYFKYLFLELDFYGTNKNVKRIEHYSGSKEIAMVKMCCYRWKTLFSFTTLKHSLNNLARVILNKAGRRSYHRNNVATTDRFLKETVKNEISHITLDKAVGMENYVYNNKYKDIFKTLKSENSMSEFVVFTSPVASYYLDLLFKEGLWEEYETWLRDLISVFGKVYHFMDYNTVTENYPHYFLDYHHVYPEIQGMMAKKVLNKTELGTPENFGYLLNSKNLDQYLDKMKKIVKDRATYKLNIAKQLISNNP